MTRGVKVIAVAGLMLACVGRPERQQCAAMAEHVVELSRAAHVGRAAEIAAATADERREDLFDRCVAEGTVAEVECVLAAETLEAIQACAP